MLRGDVVTLNDRQPYLDAVTAQAFTVASGEDIGRQIVHSIAGGWLGADWDVQGVLDLIVRADSVQWETLNGHSHALLVRVDGRRLNFQVRRPDKPWPGLSP